MLAIAFASLGLWTGVYWLLVLVRVRRVDRFTIELSEGLAEPDPGGKVSVIVPAHNESRVIERLVDGVLAQRDVAFELVVVLDRCTDDTLSRLRAAVGDDQHDQRDPRVRVVELDHCPDDWAGKCHAAAAGAAVATGDWLLFTDADVHFEPEVLRAAVGLAAAREIDLLSAFTSLTADHWWEAVVQPPAAITLLRMFPPDRVNSEDRPRSFANGQFMLFRRSTYDRIGGHDAVHDAVLEDLAFAAAVHRLDGRVRVARAGDLVTTSMYDSLGSLLSGWRRIYIEGAKRNIPRLRRNAFLVACSGLAPVVSWASVIAGLLAWRLDGLPIIAAVATTLGFFGVVTQGAVLTRVFARGGMPPIGVLGWAIGCLLVTKTLLDGAADLRRGRPIRWGGRTYHLQPGPP
jgi:glycosyltransferase involved in cell wall biosynthesis